MSPGVRAAKLFCVLVCVVSTVVCEKLARENASKQTPGPGPCLFPNKINSSLTAQHD